MEKLTKWYVKYPVAAGAGYIAGVLYPVEFLARVFQAGAVLFGG